MEIDNCNRLMTEEDALLTKAFPVLRLLLKYFEGNPVNPDRDMRMSDIEEDLETSPGELEHFQALFAFLFTQALPFTTFAPSTLLKDWRPCYR